MTVSGRADVPREGERLDGHAPREWTIKLNARGRVYVAGDWVYGEPSEIRVVPAAAEGEVVVRLPREVAQHLADLTASACCGPCTDATEPLLAALSGGVQ